MDPDPTVLQSGDRGAALAMFDWAATELGPISSWPEGLKAAFSILRDSCLPMLVLAGREGLLIYNEACKRLLGLADRKTLGARARDVWPEHASLTDLILEAGLAGRPLSLRHEPQVSMRPNPSGHAWFDLDCSPLRDAQGVPVGVLVVVAENSPKERLHALQAEKDASRLSAALAVARLGTFEWRPDTRSFTFDARGLEILGFGPDARVTWEELTGRIDPEDLARIQALAAAAEAAGHTRREYEYRIHLPSGATRNITVVTDYTLEHDGVTRRYTGVLDDVTEQRAAERRQRLLINELNHRVKNTLATIQSIAAQTLRVAPSLECARDNFEARLIALAAAHDLLNQQGWHGATLAEVAATAMSPFEAAHRPRIHCHGPQAWLSAQQALALNLALHELATNATKYGALSTASGHVELSWTVCDEQLRLRWLEQGGPAITPEPRAGFGARLLRRGLARELNGAVDWTLAPQGVSCDISCMLERVAAATPVEAAEAAGRRFNF